jgi:hypothetical protein
VDIPVYIVEKPTGQRDADGNEIVVVLEVKLSSVIAHQIAERTEGARVRKMRANKEA